MNNNEEPYLNSEYYDFGNEASPIAFGWNFQYSAGIFLFAKNANRVESIIIESKNQDIEISTTDDETIYAQAKSSIEPISCSAESKENKIIDAIISLAKTFNNHSSEKCSFVYITNVNGTFENDKDVFDNIVEKYDDLEPFYKKQIDALFEKAKEGVKAKKESARRSKEKYDLIIDAIDKFNKSKLSICVITRYYGNDSRYVNVKKAVTELLINGFKEPSETADISAEELVKYLRNVFEDSATTPSKYPSKKLNIRELIWPIAVITGRNNFNGVAFEEECFDEYPEHDVIEKGSKIAESSRLLYVERFEVSNKIINDYDDYRHLHPSDNKRLEHFVKEKAMNYEKTLLIPNGLNNDVREYVVKRLVAQVIYNKTKIVKVTNWLYGRNK